MDALSTKEINTQSSLQISCILLTVALGDVAYVTQRGFEHAEMQKFIQLNLDPTPIWSSLPINFYVLKPFPLKAKFDFILPRWHCTVPTLLVLMLEQLTNWQNWFGEQSGGMEAAHGCLGVIQGYLHITLYAPCFS